MGGEGTYIILFMLLDNNIDYDAYYYVIVSTEHSCLYTTSVVSQRGTTLLQYDRYQPQAYVCTSHYVRLPATVAHCRIMVEPLSVRLPLTLTLAFKTSPQVPSAHLPL
jgi:hypothetical protein